MRCRYLLAKALLLAAGPGSSAASSVSCDATAFAGTWTGSWWRHEGAGPKAQGAYICTAQNATHFSFHSSSPHTGWGKAGAFAVLDADFATTGRLTINFPSNRAAHRVIRATIVDRSTCSSIYLDNKSVWCKGLKPGSTKCGAGTHPPNPPTPPPPGPEPPPAPIPDPGHTQKVFVVFSNHLDVGYTDNLNGSCAAAVVNRYWEHHFPQAIATAEAFRRTNDTYRWMLAGSWVASMFRNCNDSLISLEPGGEQLLHCPNASAIAAFDAAAKRGDIGWHAFPFNAEPEVLDPSLFHSALQLTFDQDDLVGHAHRITYSQRDVPGLTRAAIPLLAKQGVRAITVGENGACAPVNVPNIFVWKDNATDTDMLTMFHPRGYGRRRMLSGSSVSEEWDGLAARDWSKHGITREGDCVEVAAAKIALCYAWKSDNQGPQTEAEARAVFASVRQAFPEATEIVASEAFDDFVRAATPYKHTLPLVTAEIGDTWIQGADTDPLKVAWYRACLRQRAACLARGECDATDPAFKTFDRLLLKVSEHTWGWNNGDIRKPKSWDNAALMHSIATDPAYRTGILTWEEQRSFVPNAVAALTSPKTEKLAAAIKAEWADIKAAPFSAVGFAEVADPSKTFVCGDATIGFGDDGSITTLRLKSSGTTWATPSAKLAQLWYQAMDIAYMNDFNSNYNIKKAGNFMKPGLNLTAVNASGKVDSLKVKAGAESTQFLLALRFPDMAHEERGAPATAEVLVSVGHSAKGANISVSAQWFKKTAFHGPETIWLSNAPAVRSSSGWVMDKLGSMIDPLDADLSSAIPGKSTCDPHQTTCGTHLHSINTGVYYSGVEGALALKPLDSGLTSIGGALAVPTPLTAPDPRLGVHFALVGNIWNTNYPEFYPFLGLPHGPCPTCDDSSSRFRFELNVK